MFCWLQLQGSMAYDIHRGMLFTDVSLRRKSRVLVFESEERKLGFQFQRNAPVSRRYDMQRKSVQVNIIFLYTSTCRCANLSRVWVVSISWNHSDANNRFRSHNWNSYRLHCIIASVMYTFMSRDQFWPTATCSSANKTKAVCNASSWFCQQTGHLT